MKFDDNDEERIERLPSEGNIDCVQHVIRRLVRITDREPEKARPALEAMIWFQNCNSNFEAENRMTIDQALLQLIEDGDYQPVRPSGRGRC